MLGLRQDDKSGVGVHVYEAGRNDMVAGVDGARRFHAAQVAAEDTHDIALHADRAVEARIAGAVDYESVFDEQVQHRITSLQAVDCRLYQGDFANL